MISPLRRLRWTLAVLCTLAVALLAVHPQRARAQFVDPVSYNVGYGLSTTQVNRFVPFSVIASNNGTIDSIAAFDMTFPAGASVISVEAVGTGCQIDGGEVSPGRVETVLTIPATPQGCAFGFGVKFAVPGEYGEADHQIEVSSGMLFLANMNITVLAPDVEPTPAPAPTTCAVTPDMAVSPELIDLAPGGTATVEVALRNLCNDAAFSDADLLVSLSDGLSVVDGSAGMLNLGQRAAWQGLSLAPGETRTWTVTVRAADTLVAAPQHISELYHRGGVAGRIDGVFITPAPVAPAAAPVIAAPAPVIQAAPAPLPAALPNTAGEREANTGLPLVALLVVTAYGLALALRRR